MPYGIIISTWRKHCPVYTLSSPTSFRAAYAEASDEQERRIAAKERKGRPSLVRSF